MKTNQQVYAETGIQVSDINTIASKFGYAQPYSNEQVQVMKSISAGAKKAGVKIKVFVQNIVMDDQSDQSGGSSPETITAEDFQSSVAIAADRLNQSAAQFYQQIDDHCAGQEEALADAVVSRLIQTPARAMSKVADRLSRYNPKFFSIAPEGASLPRFRPAQTLSLQPVLDQPDVKSLQPKS